MAAGNMLAGCAIRGAMVMLCWAGIAAGEEMTTVAYFVDRSGFDEVADGWISGTPMDEDPFAVDAELQRKFTKPIPLAEKPSGTRFLRDGDRMWLLTGHLREARVLEGGRSWAVWNGNTNRLVVHGTAYEQSQAAELWGRLRSPLRVLTDVQLIKVRCRELGFVEWSSEEIEKRGGTVQASVSTVSRPGEKSAASLGAGEELLSLEAEANCSVNADVVDFRLTLSAPVAHGDGGRRLDLSTSVVVYAGRRVYVEVGGADGGEETYLVGVTGEPQFLDGTPIWRWREFEDSSIPVGPPRPVQFELTRKVLEDGFVLSWVSVPPTFLSDIDPGSSDEGDDPFADAGSLAPRPQGAVVVAPSGVEGFLESDLVYDVGTLMKELGIRIPEGGWIYYNQTSGVLFAKLDEANTDLIAALTECACRIPPRMIQGTCSLIEWAGDLEPGRIPAGAKRLARMGVLTRVGQKATMRHGRGAERLERGLLLELDPTLGPNNRIIDMRLALEMAGESAVRLSSGLTLTEGKSVMVPLGERNGKKIGVVTTARVLDGTGHTIHDRE